MSDQWLLFLILIVFTGIGAYMLIYQAFFVCRKAVLTKGVVIQLIFRNAGYHPVVQFRPGSSDSREMVIFESSFGSRPARYHVGDIVPVLYNPIHPSKARINSLLERWIFPVVLMLFGMGTFVLFSWLLHR
ncbi:MAG: DUF3592 domain-containing protein [Ktedonobacteraceae bacterium]|nr:DUF3592 domain-containing protein [Ktedonobacteraceae bacterium]